MVTTDPAPAIESFREAFKGELYFRGDEGFEDAARGGLWNLLIPERLPDIVAIVEDEADVVTAVRFAKANTMKVSVRGGGHNWCQPSLRNSGIMIDLKNLNKVISVDATARRAVLQPIISNREAQAALKPFGMAFPTGHCPTVKISGYLLSGGMSWNQGTWGPGIGSIEAIEMVTPDGELITASESENSDYFWAARGAGPGMFAVALRYHLRLYPLPRVIAGSTYFYSMSDLERVAGWLESITPSLASNIEMSLFLVTAPPELADRCADHSGRAALVTATIFADSEDEAKTSLEPLEHCPVTPLSSSFGDPQSFESLFDLSGSLWPSDRRNLVEAHYSNASLVDLVNAVGRHTEESPSPETLVLFTIFTGPNVPAPLPDAAFSMSARYYGGPWLMWQDPADDAVNAAWRDRCVELLRPYASGHYVSESDIFAFPEHAVTAYSPANWQRLKELRTKYDPEGLFFDYFEGLN